MGTTLLIKGTLRGMGCQADCSLIATKSEVGYDTTEMFSQCAILEAPLCLPDGYYEATFCGQSAFLHRVNGVWGVGVPWPCDKSAAAEPAEPSGAIVSPPRKSMESAAK